MLVFDPQVAEQVYRQEGTLPTRPAFHSLRAAKMRDQEPVGLQGMLASNGEPWKAARNCAQVGLSDDSEVMAASFLANRISGTASTAKPGPKVFTQSLQHQRTICNPSGCHPEGWASREGGPFRGGTLQMGP